MKLLPNGLLAAETFEEHMAPDVVWLEDPAYAEAFADAAKDHEMNAFTNTIDPRTGSPSSFPAFLNLRFEGGRAILTVRGDPIYIEADDDSEAYTKAAKTVEVTLEQGDWDQFVAEATRERGLVPGG